LVCQPNNVLHVLLVLLSTLILLLFTLIRLDFIRCKLVPFVWRINYMTQEHYIIILVMLVFFLYVGSPCISFRAWFGGAPKLLNGTVHTGTEVSM
jgi:hypothetical protein